MSQGGNSSSGSQVISLPKGGGAMQGIGEKFSPDLHTGTGNFTVPIAIPPGRNGFQPQLNLVYSTGNGNGYFGLGWSLSIPGVSRKTSHGIPQYRDFDLKEKQDLFILSGAEDLVPVPVELPQNGITRYQPRTEGLFAQIERIFDKDNDYWQIRSKDGLVSIYGTPGKRGNTDSAAIGRNDKQKFAWKLSETHDPFGNKIVYNYGVDEGIEKVHNWKQPLLEKIEYAFWDDHGVESALVRVVFNYDTRLEDSFSDYRAGFEIRTTKRCKSITVETDFDQPRKVRAYKFSYDNNSLNKLSLLKQVEVIGYDDAGNAYDDSNPLYKKQLPPLTFNYSIFDPIHARDRDLIPIIGQDQPPAALGNPNYEMVDITGDGLPDIFETNGSSVRYWQNLGNGKYDLPRSMQDAPPFALADVGVQMLDANGNGRADLLVTNGQVSGYYPMRFDGIWDRRSFQPYPKPPSFNLEDPEVKLIDLDGDGLTDVIRSGTRLECFFNDADRHEAWQRTRWVERKALKDFPNVNFSDPRVKWGDMTGDGLQDIVLVYDGNIEYWPMLGHGNWGKRIHMQNSPHFRDYGYTFGYDPRRVLIGDVDGDGLADIVYVGNGKVFLWINQSGNSWSDPPIEIPGTPPVTDMDSVRLVDLLGTGVAGVLWSSDAAINGSKRPHMFFLDFTGGVKPYILNEMDNHLGATTKVEYKPSTHYYLEDRKNPKTRWRTHLPFPVQVVARVEVIDAISKGKLTTEYTYHHGYWDGDEREFRGFGMVEQRDTEIFDIYHETGLHGDDAKYLAIKGEQFSPPILTKTWFHQGPIEDASGEWHELGISAEWWQGDPPLIGHNDRVNVFLETLKNQTTLLKRRDRRHALRVLRGSILRTEMFALDGTDKQSRPYTVTESAYDVIEVPNAFDDPELPRIFYPHVKAQRTTQWERGEDPMTQFSFTDYDDQGKFDTFGRPHQQTAVAMPRRSKKRHAVTGAVVGNIAPNEIHVLATHARTLYAVPPANIYIHDRVAQVKNYELANPPEVVETKPDDVSAVLNDQWLKAQAIHDQFIQNANTNLIGHVVNHYDGTAFGGREVGVVEQYGALTRSEALVFTNEILNAAYAGDPGKPSRRPEYLGGPQVLPKGAPAKFGESIGYRKPAAIYEAGYYVDTKRVKYDLKYGLIVGMQDTLGHETQITPDQYWFLPISVKDAAGLETKAKYNYRTLQPEVVTDPNKNKTNFLYNPIGLVEKVWLESNDGQGGSVDKPELEYKYDFLVFEQTQAEKEPIPVYVHTWARQYHANVSDPAIPHSDEKIQSQEYSDGFGRLIQKRTQAEDLIFGEVNEKGFLTGDDVGLLVDGKPVPGKANSRAVAKQVADCVVVSGWQVYDNKGRVVEKFEPFFDQDWDFQGEADAKCGQHVTMIYDPRGQVIRTHNPDGSEQWVIYGVPSKISVPDEMSLDDYEPTPWEGYTYDANDLAEITFHADNPALDLTDVAKDNKHYYTPTNTLLDGLGHVICQVQRNGRDPANDAFVTRSTYDMRGNLLTMIDALGREAFKYAYDLLNRPLCVDSIDAGLRTSVLDAQGNLIEYRDSKGSIVLHQYDEVNRPTDVWAINDVKAQFTQREKIVYGDKVIPAPPKVSNLLGKPYIHYDEAGKLTFELYDFKGNLTEKIRRVVSDATVAGGWLANWIGDPIDETVLEAEEKKYQTTTNFDALNRPITVVYPKDVAGHRAKLKPIYNRAGALQSVNLDAETYVEFIAYNAKGQRVLIAYGNKVMTRYAYDIQSFRLVRLRTEAFTHPTALMYESNKGLLQDLSYQYDLVGNISQITDLSPGSGVLNNPDALRFPDLAAEIVAGEALVREFGYDPIYRLVKATGRHAARQPFPCTDYDPRREGFNWSGQAGSPTPDNAKNLTQTYTEQYAYDPAGNMLTTSRSGSAKRYFGMAGFTPKQWQDKLLVAGGAPDWGTEGNRLTNVGNEDQIQNYYFDMNGNLVQENTERHFIWDHADRLIGFSNQATPTCPASVDARYLYDSTGMRVKKWVRTNGTGDGESITYIDGIFELENWQKNGQAGDTSYLHIMDNQSRVALKRVGDIHPDDKGEAIQYQLGDHLRSSNVVIGGADTKSNVFVNREEFYPYGESSFGSFGKKRYRFTGKERDDESGLSYHAARYYSPWLTRWICCDDRIVLNEPNLFLYCSANPVVILDSTGQQGEVVDSIKYKNNADIVRERITSHRVLLPDYAVRMVEEIPGAVELVEETLGSEWKKKLVEKYEPGLPFHQIDKVFREFLTDISSKDLGEVVIKDPRKVENDESPNQENTVKFIIGKAIERAQEAFPDQTRFGILVEAFNFTLAVRATIHPSVSQSIALRNADHYFAARIAEYRKELPFYDKEDVLKPPSRLESLNGLYAKLGYEMKKSLLGYDIATSDMPPAPRGGSDWVESGISDYLYYDYGVADQKGSPTRSTKPSELKSHR